MFASGMLVEGLGTLLVICAAGFGQDNCKRYCAPASALGVRRNSSQTRGGRASDFWKIQKCLQAPVPSAEAQELIDPIGVI